MTPWEQASEVIANDGTCSREWDCSECYIRPHLGKSACFRSMALSIAEGLISGRLRPDSDDIDRCESIW